MAPIWSNTAALETYLILKERKTLYARVYKAFVSSCYTRFQYSFINICHINIFVNQYIYIYINEEKRLVEI